MNDFVPTIPHETLCRLGYFNPTIYRRGVGRRRPASSAGRPGRAN